jgi:hypothetical protein
VEKNIEDFLRLPLPGAKVVIGDGPQRADLESKYPEVRFLGKKVGAEPARQGLSIISCEVGHDESKGAQ